MHHPGALEDAEAVGGSAEQVLSEGLHVGIGIGAFVAARGVGVGNVDGVLGRLGARALMLEEEVADVLEDVGDIEVGRRVGPAARRAHPEAIESVVEYAVEEAARDGVQSAGAA